MYLSQLRVHYIRNHRDITCEFGRHMTLIHGKNGTGKTSLLESIYILYRGVSFKGSDKDIINHLSSWYRIDARDNTEYDRCIVYDTRTVKPVKEFTIDGKRFSRLPQRYKQPIVLFTPNDLRLVDGSPTRRREYVDTCIVQLKPAYSHVLHRYGRALQQRNRLLKYDTIDTDQLFSWNIILSEAGATIINERHAYIERVNQRMRHHYRSIAHTNDDVSIEYSYPVTTPAKLFAQYEQMYERDRVMRSTSTGPHRHDVYISLRTSPAATTASRGEMRTIVIACKYIEAELLAETYDEYPLILLDDVYGELDAERRQSVAHTLSEYQIIITSTDKISGLPRTTRRIEL